jgi:hypothetical protein
LWPLSHSEKPRGRPDDKRHKFKARDEMERCTPIFIITSLRPRVGKTLLARLLGDFFRADDRAATGFDVNPDSFALVEYQPDTTLIGTISDTRGQMTLIDKLLLSDNVPKIVDLAHSFFNRFFTMLHEISFAEEARRTSIIPVVLFIAGTDLRSRQGYDTLRDNFPQFGLVPVFNHALPSIMLHREIFPAPAALTLSALSPVLKAVIDRPNFSFAAFARSHTDASSELYLWTRRIFLQFRDLELRLLLEELKPDLQIQN